MHSTDNLLLPCGEGILELEIRNLTVEFRMKRTGERVRALDSLSLRLEPGRFVTIVGPSGCGKTTLLKSIAGLIRPTSGEILIQGHRVERPGAERAIVFQTPALLPWRTVLRNVSYGLELQGVSAHRAQEKARRYIEMVGLSGFYESYPNELSEGMRQRVNLARAMSVEPRLLLLDEPFAALDSQTRTFMQLELQSIWQRSKASALFVTHQITEAILLGDEVIVLSARPGRIKESLDVNLERPRTIEMKRSAEFNLLEERVWDLIQEESLALSRLQPAS